ncbi:Zinc finger, C2H2 type family protein [Tritrichomonas foetus]|uniref:Zinc finger, C2H2 type family protein n=1 Tax=Tritrichomonas foetus TaxID=1144522 RepID=A0A1J4KQ70_9EUKA|nr:Zinc finger, C2H2 type family protein [Tritrichomonas foetus]|eukprot:OHT13258.1 Zinc finger, C2H2 type family protein [Tritrichomonas foetus]
MLFSLNDKNLRDLGFTAANRATFQSWVGSLYKPRNTKTIDAGKRIASPKSAVRRSPATSSSQNVTNRLFSASLQRRKPQDDNYNVCYQPRITGAMRYGGQVDDGFDIKDLMFTPGPQLKELPKRLPPPGAKRRRMKWDVPEDGDCDSRGPCRFCGRKFALDRLSVHESICAHSSSRRRPFNSRKQRLAGTGVYGTKSPPPKPKTSRRPGEKPKYVQEHEELVRLLRAARMAESGGKVRMPAPRVGPDDRMQCPYCGRRFGRDQAERHMRFCENNRPAPRGPMTTCKVARGGTYRF